jgi:hypothetical protein
MGAMFTTRVLARGIVLIALLAIVAVTVMSAQAPASPPQAGVPELLAEVRALRAEVNQAAGASMRMQLLVARLTLQEQRIAAAGRQLHDVQGELSAAMGERSKTETALRELQRATPPAEPLPPEVHQEIRVRQQQQLRFMQETLSQQLQREEQLRLREGELLVTVATEQARWTDFNARLDELERTLPAASR